MKAALSDALSDLTFALDEIPNDYPVNLVDIDTLCNKRDSHGAEYIVKLIYNVTVYGVSIYKNIPRIRNDYDLKNSITLLLIMMQDLMTLGVMYLRHMA